MSGQAGGPMVDADDVRRRLDEIDYLEDQQVIVCRTCGYRYPVRDDIPVMLIDEAEKPGGPR